MHRIVASHYKQLVKTYRATRSLLEGEANSRRASLRRLDAAHRDLASLVQSERAERQLLRNALVMLQAARFRGTRNLGYAEALLAVGTHEANAAIMAAQIALLRAAMEHIEGDAASEPRQQSAPLTDTVANDRGRPYNDGVFLSQRFGG